MTEDTLAHLNLEVTHKYVVLAAVASITKKTRVAQELSQSAFMKALLEKLPGLEITEKVVNHWESGRQTPAYLFLVGVFRSYGDWRYDWALGCLAAMRPEIWGETPSSSELGI